MEKYNIEDSYGIDAAAAKASVQNLSDSVQNSDITITMNVKEPDYSKVLENQKKFIAQYIADYEGWQKILDSLDKQYADDPDNKSYAAKKAAIQGMMKDVADMARLNLEDSTTGIDDSIISFLDNAMKLHVTQLTDEIDELDAQIADELLNGNIDNAKELNQRLGVLRKRLQSESDKENTKKDADNKSKETDTKNKKDTISKKVENWKSVVSSVNDLASAAESAFGPMNDTIRKTVDTTVEFANQTISMVGAIANAGAIGSEVTEKAGDGSAKALKKVEKASVILAAISAGIKIIQAIVNAFNQDKNKERDIEKLKYKINDLKKSYDDLEKSIEKSYSFNASKQILKSNNNLLEQRKLIEEQMRLEQSKKKTDWGKVDDYKKRLNEIGDAIEDNKAKAIDVIFNEDLKTAIDNFASAYADAWSSGEDKAASMKDVVRKMIRAAVMEMMKSDLRYEVDDLRKKIKAALENDGEIDADEEKGFDEIVGRMLQRGKGYEKFDKYFVDEQPFEPSSKGIESMSQDTAEELNGRFTTIQAHTGAIVESMGTLVENSKSTLTVLNEIKDHTARLDNIENHMGTMSSTLRSMEVKGIKLNTGK